MVGMVISLTATLGLLSIYRNSLQITTTSVSNSTSDSQLAALLLRTGESVEDAGYGITGAALGTDIVAISGATFSGTTLSGTAAGLGAQANAIVWDSLTGASTQCAGFIAQSSGVLLYLKPTPCASASSWASIAWTSTSQVTSQASSPITFTFAQQNCQPYGITATSGNYTVTLGTQDSIGATVSSLQCLINFQ
jgi:hypothetical protein